MGGLNGSLGSRAHSGLLDPSTPRGSRSSLNPNAQGSPGHSGGGRPHQTSDMQVRQLNVILRPPCSAAASSLQPENLIALFLW